MTIFDSIGKGFKWIAQKTGDALISVGKKVGSAVATGLDYGIQGLKIASDFADKYTLGLTHLIPYYSAIKSGIDIADHVRKMVKGEEKLNWSNALDMGTDALFGAISLGSGASELKGWVKGAEKFAEYGKKGTGTAFRLRGATREVLKGYGVHKSQLSQGLKSISRFGKMVKDGHPKQILQAAAGATAATGVGAVAVAASNEQDQRRSAVPQSAPQSVPSKFSAVHPLMQAPKPAPLPQANSQGVISDKYGNVIGNTI